MLDFNPSFKFDELEERVVDGWFDVEIYNYLIEILKYSVIDSKRLLSGELDPCDLFTLTLTDCVKDIYIDSKNYLFLDREMYTLLKDKINSVFHRVLIDYNKYLDLSGLKNISINSFGLNVSIDKLVFDDDNFLLLFVKDSCCGSINLSKYVLKYDFQDKWTRFYSIVEIKKGVELLNE